MIHVHAAVEKNTKNVVEDNINSLRPCGTHGLIFKFQINIGERYGTLQLSL